MSGVRSGIVHESASASGASSMATHASGRSRSNPSIPAVSRPRSFSVVNAKLLSASRSIPATRFMLRSSMGSGVGTAIDSGIEAAEERPPEIDTRLEQEQHRALGLRS